MLWVARVVCASGVDEAACAAPKSALMSGMWPMLGIQGMPPKGWGPGSGPKAPRFGMPGKGFIPGKSAEPGGSVAVPGLSSALAGMPAQAAMPGQRPARGLGEVLGGLPGSGRICSPSVFVMAERLADIWFSVCKVPRCTSIA